MTLLLKNLNAKIENKQVLENINIEIGDGEVHALFGQNGSGKTTLARVLMGLFDGKVSGIMQFNGKDLNKIDVDERAREGIFMSFQHPPTIVGIKLKDLLELGTKDYKKVLKEVNLSEEFSKRNFGLGFSGGEKKRAELSQILAFKPKFLILDEIDSGVDIENLKLIGEVLSAFIQKNKSSVLIITHNGFLLKFLKPKKAYVMIHSKIVCEGEYERIWKTINEKGYRWCEKCQKK